MLVLLSKIINIHNHRMHWARLPGDKPKSTKLNLVGVGVDGFHKCRVQRVFVLSSILGASRDSTDDTKRNLVNTTLQSPQHGGNRLSEGGQAQEAMLANHGP